MPEPFHHHLRDKPAANGRDEICRDNCDMWVWCGSSDLTILSGRIIYNIQPIWISLKKGDFPSSATFCLESSCEVAII